MALRLLVLAALARAQAPANFRCPEKPEWVQLYNEVIGAAQRFNPPNSDFAGAKQQLVAAITAATADIRKAFECTLGISAAYRALAFTFAADLRCSGCRRMRSAGRTSSRCASC